VFNELTIRQDRCLNQIWNCTKFWRNCNWKFAE